MVLPSGIKHGQAIANEITRGTIIDIAILTAIVVAINYFSLKGLLKAHHPFLISCFIALISISIFVPFFLSARKSYLDFQLGNTDLTKYIDMPIARVILCNAQDTVVIDDIERFLTNLKKAKLQRGFWKYLRNEKIIFYRTEGISDTIFTNGQMFGSYKGYWFAADTNILDKYFNDYKSQ
jgi:hypothetical protein